LHLDPYPDPYPFSKPWIRIQIRKKWMRIRNPGIVKCLGLGTWKSQAGQVEKAVEHAIKVIYIFFFFNGVLHIEVMSWYLYAF